MSEATPQALPARSERVERKRQRILDAAGHCFGTSGFSKATVEEIAATAGVSKALVYHHFRGKEAIFEELLERTLTEWARVGSIEEHLAEDGSIRTAIAGMLRASLRYAQNNPLVRSLFQLDPTVVRFVGSSATVHRHVEEGRARMIHAIERAVERGELRGDLEPTRVADVARMLTMALIDHLLNPEWLNVTDDRFVETCLEVLFHGIAPRNA
jgi:AcrR family transcriptional regulator